MNVRRLPFAAALAAALVAAPAASASSPEAVRLEVSVILAGNLSASTTVGTFSASGAITDAGTEHGAGRFAGEGHLRTGEPNSLHSTMTLVGADGTITIDLVGLFGRLPAPLASGDGRWVVQEGTGAYAELHARGSWAATADFREAFALTGPPRVYFVFQGTEN
jgi:hypothetical protein